MMRRAVLSLSTRRIVGAVKQPQSRLVVRVLLQERLQHNTVKTKFDLPDPSDRDVDSLHKLQLTKIVATIGPTSEQREPLKLVTNAGMRIMRLNFSHATKEEVELRCTNLALAQVRRSL